MSILSTSGDSAVIAATEPQMERVALAHMFPQQQVLGSQIVSGINPMSPRSLSSKQASRRDLARWSANDILRAYQPVSHATQVPPAEAKAWCLTPGTNYSSDKKHTDLAQITAILQWLTHRRPSRLVDHPPFSGWPKNHKGCTDTDGDGVPDNVENLYVGTNPEKKSSAGDGYLDSQKIFDSDPEGAGLPGYVKAPYDSPYVAALPSPDVTVEAGSRLHVQLVEQIYSGNTTSKTNETDYSVSQTHETSQSIANTQTWNKWQEMSTAISRPYDDSARYGHWMYSRPVRRGVRRAIDCSNVGTNFQSACADNVAFWGDLVSDVYYNCGPSESPCSFAGYGNLFTSLCDHPGALPNYILTGAWGDNSKACGVKELTGLIPPPAGTGHTDNGRSYTPPAANQYDPQAAKNLGSIDQSMRQLVTESQEGYEGIAQGFNGLQLSIDKQSQVLKDGLTNVANAISEPRITTTNTSGQSWGGSQTVTSEESQSNTVTNGAAFFDGQSWTNATTTDTSHAADLTFGYDICDTGHNVMPALKDLVFNVQINGNVVASYASPIPTSRLYPPGTVGAKTCATYQIPTNDALQLGLDQLRQLDEYGNLQISVESFDYQGQDPVISAENNGVNVLVDDGSGTLAQYVIPNWSQDNLQNVLESFFCPSAPKSQQLGCAWDSGNRIDQIPAPSFNSNGNMTGWTPHPASDNAWWRLLYVDTGQTTISPGEQLKSITVPPNPGWELLIRFDQDSDHDGYPDSIERQVGTDPNNPNSHPTPNLIGAYTEQRTGNNVKVDLELQNTGNFQASGISAIAYSPDSTTTVTKNTVGTNGVVGPGQRIAVGGFIDPPDLSNWGSSAAQPIVGGSYLGDSSATYTFTAANAGTAGRGNTSMSWQSSNGDSGTIDLGSDYTPGTSLPVSFGLAVGFGATASGLDIASGTSFTVTAFSPQDQFSYTINNPANYTPPVIVVGYADPQGFHQFVVPPSMKLTTLNSDLSGDGSQMQRGEGMQILSTSDLNASGQNTTNIELDNASSTTITGSQIHVDFASAGKVVYSKTLTENVPPGVSTYPVTWSTSNFSSYTSGSDTNAMVVNWTDAGGTIIDRAARPLNTLASDPTGILNPRVPQSISIGAVTQGAIGQGTLPIVNTGFGVLNVSLSSSDSNVSILGPDGNPASGVIPIPPSAEYTAQVSVDSGGESTGTLDSSVTVTTNDGTMATQSVPITGTVNAPPKGTQAMAFDVPNHPWDKLVHVYGPLAQGTNVTFNDNMQPSADDGTIQPCLVYRSDGSQAGVGQACADFGKSQVSADLFGNGSLGDYTVQSSTDLDTTRAVAYGAQGSTNLNVEVDQGSFSVSDLILIHETQGANAGAWETNHVTAVNVSFCSSCGESVGDLTLTKPLANNYYADGTTGRAQVLVVPQYRNLTIPSGVTVSPEAWNTRVGGIEAFDVGGKLDIQPGGSIDASGSEGSPILGVGYGGGGEGGGFRGGNAAASQSSGDGQLGQQGEGTSGPGERGQSENGTGGGGGQNVGAGSPGGGGGHAGPGSEGYQYPTGGQGAGGNAVDDTPTVGSTEPSLLDLGSGGGGAGNDGGQGGTEYTGAGGSGGGAIVIAAAQLDVEHGATVTANGGGGGITNLNEVASGGGGAGGYVWLDADTASLGNDQVTAQGGSGGIRTTDHYELGGEGAPGVIAIGTCQSLGSTSPTFASLSPCGIATEPAQPTVSFTVPDEVTNGQDYTMQFGQDIPFTSDTSSVVHVRVPNEPFSSATMDGLITNVTSPGGPDDVEIDAGNTGPPQCSWPGTITQSSHVIGTAANPCDISAGVNAYISAHPTSAAYVDVPITVSSSLDGQSNVILTNLSLSAGPAVDLAVSNSDLKLTCSTSPCSVTAGTSVPVTLTVHNQGPQTTLPFDVGFYAGTKATGVGLIGNGYVGPIASGSTGVATITWNTTGWTGPLTVYAIADPTDAIAETSKSNNGASVPVTIK